MLTRPFIRRLTGTRCTKYRAIRRSNSAGCPLPHTHAANHHPRPSALQPSRRAFSSSLLHQRSRRAFSSSGLVERAARTTACTTLVHPFSSLGCRHSPPPPPPPRPPSRNQSSRPECYRITMFAGDCANTVRFLPCTHIHFHVHANRSAPRSTRTPPRDNTVSTRRHK